MTRCQVECRVTEDIRRKYIEKSHGEDDYPGRDDQAPEGQAERLLTSRFLIELCQKRIAQEDLRTTQENEAGGRGEERPILVDVWFEQRSFGDNESTLLCQTLKVLGEARGS